MMTPFSWSGPLFGSYDESSPQIGLPQSIALPPQFPAPSQSASLPPQFTTPP